MLHCLPNAMLDAPNNTVYQLNCNNINKAMLNWPARNAKASFLLNSPLVIGRFRVRSTFLSISASHMSLIVHPAPLIIIAPIAIRPNMNGSGSSPADPAMPMLHPQGQNRSQDPIGLSNLMSRKYG